MPKIIQGKDRESRVKRLEENVEIERKGKKEKLGPPPWAGGGKEKDKSWKDKDKEKDWK